MPAQSKRLKTPLNAFTRLQHSTAIYNCQCTIVFFDRLERLFCCSGRFNGLICTLTVLQVKRLKTQIRALDGNRAARSRTERKPPGRRKEHANNPGAMPGKYGYLVFFHDNIFSINKMIRFVFVLVNVNISRFIFFFRGQYQSCVIIPDFKAFVFIHFLTFSPFPWGLGNKKHRRKSNPAQWLQRA